ncbi:hypothetical protein CMI37_03440 [Candidatus Pacearchaeota archaeon]|nr:hypothetical protein [Candidatus Pacearchaeota archaeon]
MLPDTPKIRIARALDGALPSPKRRARRAGRRARARPEVPVTSGTPPEGGPGAVLAYAIDRNTQLLDSWTERDPNTLAGRYYLDLLHLTEDLSILLGD